MGKTVIAGRTRGQDDLLADDAVVLQDGSGRSTSGYFAFYFAPAALELHGPTGILCCQAMSARCEIPSNALSSTQT
jgi:hypothetical protein